MSLEQMYLQIHHTGTVTGSGCRLPCAGGHETSRPDGPSHRRRSPRKAVAVAASLLSAPGRSREKLLTPSVLASAQRRWNHRPRRVWRRAGAWVRPPVECRHPSAPRRGAAVVRRVPPLSERRHHPRSSSPTPSASPGPRPQPRNSLRHPAVWLTLLDTSLTLLGAAISLIASTFSGSGWIPSPLMVNPKYFVSVSTPKRRRARPLCLCRTRSSPKRRRARPSRLCWLLFLRP